MRERNAVKLECTYLRDKLLKRYHLRHVKQRAVILDNSVTDLQQGWPSRDLYLGQVVVVDTSLRSA